MNEYNNEGETFPQNVLLNVQHFVSKCFKLRNAWNFSSLKLQIRHGYLLWSMHNVKTCLWLKWRK